MKVATLSIGDELLFGEVVNTNAAHIAERLYRIGIKVCQHLTVGDTEQGVMAAIDSLSLLNDHVIVTGGLGPTSDDMTSRAVSRVTGRRLILNDKALAHLHELVGKFGGTMTPANEKQALLPARSTLIPNPRGTAAGYALTHKDCLMFFLPGVPAEMARMLEDSVIPFLEKRRSDKTVVKTKVLRVFGLAEADLGTVVDTLATAYPGVTTAYRVSFPEIMVRFRAEGTSADDLEGRLAAISAVARDKLEGYLFAEDEDTMDSVVAALFRSTGATLSLAESCTGGMIAARITDLPGSSAYFLEGVITYSDEAKTRTLQVSPQLLAEKGAVSSETALAMARGVRALTGSDLALAVTGIAGPAGGTEEKPVGTVFIALADKTGCRAKRYLFHGSRAEIRLLTVFTAMDWLRRQLTMQAS